MIQADVPNVLERLGIDSSWVDDRGEAWSPCPLPFGNHKHGDKRPSFSVNIETGLFNCFVCGGGSLYDLVSHIKGISTPEAREWLKSLGRKEYNSETDFKDTVLSRLEKRQETTKRAPHKVDPNRIPREWEEGVYHPWLAESGISVDTALKMGITYLQEQEGIIFPHYWNGKLVGAQMRDLTGLSRAKYKNTVDFPKRSTLYNLYNVIGNDDVIVFESPKTVAVMDSRGYPNCVATFGAEISSEQLVPLWRFKTVYLWFDNDKAGQRALSLALEGLLEQVQNILIVPFVDKEKGDAADISSEEVSSYLDRAESYFHWKLRNKKNAKP